MRLSTRLWLLGALVPSLVVLLALMGAGQLFRVALESSLDQGLMAQAAAESVSLFDRPDGPHLHMAESPLLDEIRPFAPTAELFNADGELMAHFPPTPHPDTVTPPPVSGPHSEFLTREVVAGRQREMVVRLTSADGQAYVLRLSASLAQVDESVRTFYSVAIGAVIATGLFLLVLQSLVARRLAQRLGALSAHLEAVKSGQLDLAPPPDLGHDEIGSLREVLAATTVQLQQARAVQDRLVADAAHELRTPLTLMRTTLDLALRRERSPDELRSALIDARAEVERLAQLATALLDMATASRSVDLAWGDLSVVVEEAAEAARATAEERGVLLELNLVRPAKARFSAASLRQAIDNLLANALRFAPPGTSISVELAAAPEHWRLTVRDCGPGIPDAERQAVFAPFRRLEKGGGSGLGLAIVSEVMRHHGGTAKALEPNGPGALIALDLPRLA